MTETRGKWSTQSTDRREWLNSLCRAEFLGERTYLQGTTMFGLLAPNLEGATDIRFKIRRSIHSDQVLLRDFPIPGKAADVEASYVLPNGESRNWWVYGHAPSEAQKRTPFDESEITDGIVFGEGAATLHGMPPHSVCTVLVSMNKALLERQLPQPAKGRWVFVGATFSSYPFWAAPFTVRKQDVLAGGRLVRSEFEIPGASGDLLFSWLQEPLRATAA